MKRQILFVDDEPRVLQGLQRMLRGQTDVWDMNFATSAAEALELLSQKCYDAAVLDVSMPGKNGLELLSELKADTRTRDIEVVMLTGLQDQSLKRQALDLGAADLLDKPAQREDLLARLNSVLRMRSYHEELQTQNAILEQQLIQSQKMELVGLLAAGVAHDFNNILQGIMGYAGLTARYVADDSRAQEKLKKIEALCNHAKKVVQQILKFSKQTERPREPCDLSAVIDENVELLQASLPKGGTIEWDGLETDRQIQANATQMYQLLMNLCINAVQAMDSGGVLKISLTETKLDVDSELISDEIHPGTYMKLEVSDTGRGMDQATIHRIFDPLFTTKGSKGGTGIGLSVVQRIVKNHGGLITVESEPGKGTTFFIYLPCDEKENVTNQVE